jgi:alginate O-acetyltransferase complex protein AlgI
MIFSSLQFFVFFVVLLTLLIVIKNDRARRWLLALGSLFFYGAWNPAFLPLLVGNAVVGWATGMLISDSASIKSRKHYLWWALFFFLGTLGYFKYALFFQDNLRWFFGIEEWAEWQIILPVGISFFTFQAISYVIDVYRGDIKPCRNLFTFLIYIAFFPQLIAGPIVRANEFLPQLVRRINIKRPNILIGLQIFGAGFLQKYLIADTLAFYVDPIFSNPELYSPATLWLGLISYTIQIFCDFSGYSLMAIGCARTLGFRLPENFRMPYLSQSITEFWRRWHMTLSRWLRDYLYVSLGGNRSGQRRTYVNLLLTMLLGGLWHGASWNFVLWGALHGGALAIHRYWVSHRTGASDKLTRRYRFFAWALTLLFVTLAWVPFRSADFATTLVYMQGLTFMQGGVDWLNGRAMIAIIVVVLWHYLAFRGVRGLFGLPSLRPFEPVPLLALSMTAMVVLLFGPDRTSPFIYFQF